MGERDRDFVRLRFSGTITLDHYELERASGDPVQTVQNALGYAGAQIEDADVDDFLMADEAEALAEETDGWERIEALDDLTDEDVEREWPAS